MIGLVSYLVFFLILALIFSVAVMGLNLLWGYTGLFNAGVAGFLAVGGYAMAMLTGPSRPQVFGGFELPFVVGLIGAMGAEDLSTAMSLAAIAGQLDAVSNLVSGLEMPILAAFLVEKSDDLHEMAVDTMFRSAATRALASAVEATGKDVAALGVNEIAEGLDRLAVSDAMAVRSMELEEEGLELAAAGMVEAAAAEGMREAAKDWAAEGVGEVAAGSAELGAADVLDTLAEGLEEEADE